MVDHVAILDQVIGEADQVIRRRLRDHDMEVPHLFVAVTSDNKVVLRSNVSTDCLRSFADDLNRIADELEESPAPHLWSGLRGTGRAPR
jgi:hypothetical protein